MGLPVTITDRAPRIGEEVQILARSDLLLTLVKAGSAGDKVLFRRAVEAMIAEERAKQHFTLAEQLSNNLSPSNNIAFLERGNTTPGGEKTILEIVPRKSLNNLILPSHVAEICAEIVEEHNRRDLLRSYGLEPRHKILIAGPPGNGKTSLAEAVAEALAVPLMVVKYDSLIDSYLGSTAQKLASLFDYVRTRPCVLFFDEFDTLGKERGDSHETGEIKRVVSSLLLQIDALPSHVIVVTATNHPELLDRAVWRRFQARFQLPKPTKADVLEWCARFETRSGVKLGAGKQQIGDKFAGSSFAELEEFTLDIQRRLVLKEENLSHLLKSRLAHWDSRFSC